MFKTSLKLFILICAVAAIFVYIGRQYGSPDFGPWVITAYVIAGAWLFSPIINGAVELDKQLSPQEWISTELDQDGIYEVLGVFKTKRSNDEWFILHLQDLKNNQEQVFWQTCANPQGFREVKNGDRTFLVSEKEELILKLLPFYGVKG